LRQSAQLRQCYVADPWSGPLSFRPGEKLLLIGNGLTMADVAMAAAAQAKEQIVIHTISRHGLVPPAQTAFAHTASQSDSTTSLHAASSAGLRLLRAARVLADETERRGGDWREAIHSFETSPPRFGSACRRGKSAACYVMCDLTGTYTATGCRNKHC